MLCALKFSSLREPSGHERSGRVYSANTDRATVEREPGQALRFLVGAKTARQDNGSNSLREYAKQFRRLKKVLKRQRTILGIVMREVRRKSEGPDFAPDHPKAASELTMWLERAGRIRT